MNYARVVWLVSLAPGATGCGNDPLICTDELVVITATVVNLTGQTFTGLTIRDTVLRTETVLDITAEHPSSGLPADGIPALIIFSDAFKNAILLAGEAVAVAITAGDHSASARYEFGTDGCHVRKLAGPDTLEVR